ncbi:Splicing factor U2af large subunit A [Glycine max]|nr:Splicing factor U2af large subunit A [Glycine max]
MADYDERYEGNGEEEELHNSLPHPHPQPDSSPHPTHDDLTDSKSHHGSRDYDRDSSRSRDKEREKGRDREKKREKGRDRERDRSRDRDSERSRDKDRDREKSKDRERDRDRDRDGGEKERDRDRDRHHRDRHRDRGERRERTRDRDDDDHHRSRDFDRRRDYDREDRHRHRSRSQSQSRSGGRSEHRSRSRSRSRSKSKRTSGFDMAPPASAMLAGASAVAESESSEFVLRCNFPSFAGQITGANPTIPGMFPNMFPLATNQMQQFSALPVMPVQAMTQQATRHARRVYVGGLPPTANEQSVATFFSQVMAKIGGNTAGPGDAVVNVYINHDKKFAFVEMRSVEEASNAMALDGIIFEGAPVKVRRPTDYNPSLAATLGPSQPNPNLNLGAVGLTPGSAGGLDGPDRIFVGGLPYYFTETQIRELLETFGPLRGFDLVKDRETGNSKGYAFCVYQDLAVTDIACAALNGIKMGDKTLTVRRANQGANPQQPKPEQESILMHAQQQIALQKLMLQPALVATKVVCLTHAVSSDELKDDEDYDEILDDMRQECSKFGTLVNVVIPRPPPDGEPAAGVGKVFLEYVDIDGATKARAGLNGRKFDGNQVVAVFYPENKFAQGDYEG